MFDIGLSEIVVVAAVALIVIGPKDLPQLMHKLGGWAGQARGWMDKTKTSIMTADLNATDAPQSTEPRYTTKPPAQNL